MVFLEDINTPNYPTNHVQQPQQSERLSVNSSETPKKHPNTRIIAMIAVLIISVVLIYLVYITPSLTKSTTTLKTSSSTTIFLVKTTANSSNISIAPAQSGSSLNPQSIKNGAEAADYAIQKLITAGSFNQTSQINMNTYETSRFVSGLIHDSISFYIGKNATETYFYLEKQTVSSPVGQGLVFNYSGHLKIPLYVNCFGTICMNTTEPNMSDGERALFNNFFDPVAEDIGRFVSFYVPNNYTLDGAAVYLYNTKLVNYSFERYTVYDNTSCALMHVYVPKQVGLLANSFTGYIYLNGTTCLSNATGLPIYTNLTFYAYNDSGSPISVNGTFVQTSIIKNN